MRAPSSEGEAVWHDSPSVKFNYKATSKHSARVCYRLQEGESKRARGTGEGCVRGWGTEAAEPA